MLMIKETTLAREMSRHFGLMISYIFLATVVSLIASMQEPRAMSCMCVYIHMNNDLVGDFKRFTWLHTYL